MRETLAVKYRPKTFEDVCGQTNQIKILENQLKTGQHKNAYLFAGYSGCGKTTLARIFAKELNKGKGQPIELDAARNNSVDDIRSMIDDSSYKSMDSEYRIYILDEAHQLSASAWSALLKVLEEPPSKTIFILCTTDPQKIPMTILNRVQRFDFKKIDDRLIKERLNYIIRMEEERIDPEAHEKDIPIIDISKESLDYIIKLSNGGMRDAIALLDKCLSYSHSLDVDEVTSALGISSYDDLIMFMKLIKDKDRKGLLDLINSLSNNGIDLKQNLKQFYLFLVDVCKYLLTEDVEMTKIPSIYESEIKEFNYKFCLYLLEEFMIIYETLKWEDSIKELLTAKVLVLTKEEKN